MNHVEVIEFTTDFVRKTLHGAEGGHDWWHIYRVWKTARKIAETEEVDLLVVELGALMHDIADSKFHGGDESIGPQMAGEFLKTLNLPEETIVHVQEIIRHISFKGGKETQQFKSPELDVVQDADRLDALGAIGIARTFNYGGHRNREIYNPEIKPDMNMNKDAYKNSTAPTLNHFYEKLLLLKDRMNTKTGKEMAMRRHNFMLTYLEEFYKEWVGR
ncbi:MAG: HD domain-containing protein [Bacteroidales bacterium]|nr:HD domain-containing protein [Bacteroidales bacterium]